MDYDRRDPWRRGLDAKFKSARTFYLVVIASTLVGMAMDYANISLVKALFWTAVVNGLLAPFLLSGVLLVAIDRQIMHNQPSSHFEAITVAVTILAMFGAAVGMFHF